jgi:hypothetical protein
MNTAPQSIAVITPLKALWRWLVATPDQTQHVPCSTFNPPASTHRRTSNLRSHTPRTTPSNVIHSVVRRPVRMVRVMEAGQTSAQVGRMVISGRMADVCAELDRLVAHEARMH